MIDNTPKNDGLRKIDENIREKFNALPEEKKLTQKAKTFVLYPFELKMNQEKSFDEKIQDAEDLIERHLKRFKHCYVATSFGNDSIVLMDMVIRVARRIGVPVPDMFLNDTLNTFKEEKQYWEQMIKFFGIEKEFKKFTPPKDKDGKQQTVWSIAKKYGHLPSFRAMGGRGASYKKLHKNSKIKDGSKGQTPECCNILKKKSMKEFFKTLPVDNRYDCSFIGTRADESRMRAMSVLQRCRSYLITSMFPHPIRAVTPLSYFYDIDIQQYYVVYNIPQNPAYKAHNMERMGCASCPAHKNWEMRLVKDPTNEGFGMLKMNLKILSETEPQRFISSINNLEKYLTSKESKTDMTSEAFNRAINLLQELKNHKLYNEFKDNLGYFAPKHNILEGMPTTPAPSLEVYDEYI